MRGDQFFIVNDFHMIDESFDGHGLERHLSRHAVADPVKANHLVFVDRHRAPHAGFEGVTRQRGRLPDVELQYVGNRELYRSRCFSNWFFTGQGFTGRRIDASRRRRS